MGEDKSYTSLHDFIRVMLTNLIEDARKRNVDIKIDSCKLMEQFESEKYAFEEVSHASMVHWDLWEGNVFVKYNHNRKLLEEIFC